MTKRAFDPVEPTALRELHARNRSFRETGEAIGLSYSSISKYLSDNACPPYVEIAAKALIERADGPQQMRLIVVRAPKGQGLDMLKVFLKGAGLRFMEFSE